MTKRPQLIIPAVIVGLVFLAIAIVYWTTGAASLPSFFPGHESGSSNGIAYLDQHPLAVR